LDVVNVAAPVVHPFISARRAAPSNGETVVMEGDWHMLQKALKTAFLAGAGAAAMGGQQAKADECPPGFEVCIVIIDCYDVVHCEQNCTVTPEGTVCDEPVCHIDTICDVLEICWCDY
jgi:hypothetical protein